jgi:LysR family transcriptional regulator for metE and metH
LFAYDICVQRIAPLQPAPALEIRDLRVALALASAGSTARAASVLHLTQPAVSRALLSLEERLGAKVFDRTARGLRPTAAGARLLQDAPRVLTELSELERRVRGEPEVQHLRVVCECYTAYHWLPSALASLREGAPGLSVELSLEHTSDPAGALADGKVDVALLTTAVTRGKVDQRPLFSDEIIFVMSRTHALAAKKSLTPADLERSTLLTSSRAAPGEALWFSKQVFGKARPKLKFELLPLTEAMIDMARAGHGVAILSEWVANPHLKTGDLVVKRVSSGPLRRPWRLAWQKPHREAALRLGAALAATAPHPSISLF